MKIHHLRNATLVIESGAMHILVDPMFSHKGQLPAYARLRHPPLRNPLVSLPDAAARVLDKASRCLVTRCPMTRSQLKRVLEAGGLLSKVIIPDDGQAVAFYSS